jgi:hypothetical protein
MYWIADQSHRDKYPCGPLEAGQEADQADWLSKSNSLRGLAEKLGLKGYGKDGFGPGQDFTRPDDFYIRMVANVATDGSPVPDADDAERLAGEDAQAERGAQDLAAAFAERTVNLDHRQISRSRKRSNRAARASAPSKWR